MTIKSRQTIKLPRPTECNMPDLSDLDDKNILGIANKILTGDIAKEYKSKAFIINFVRITDQTIREYRDARIAFLEYINNQPSMYISPLFEAIGHFETLLIGLRRASLLIRRMKRNEETSRIVNEQVNKDVDNRIENIRHAIEHLDEKLAKGEINEGDPWFLIPQNDYIHLYEHKVSYQEIAEYIRTLHSIAQKI